MTRTEKSVLLALLGFLFLGVVLRFAGARNSRVNLRAVHAAAEIPAPTGGWRKPRRRAAHRRGRRPRAKAFAGTVDINRAGAEDLARLPALGKKLAAAIEAYRRDHGPFKEKNDLLRVPGLSVSLYRKIEPCLICSAR